MRRNVCWINMNTWNHFHSNWWNCQIKKRLIAKFNTTFGNAGNKFPKTWCRSIAWKKKYGWIPNFRRQSKKKAFTVLSDNRQRDDHRFDLLSLQFHCLNSLQKKLMPNRKKNVFSKWLDIAKHIEIIPCADWFMQALIFTFYAIRKSQIKMLCSVAVVKSIVTEKKYR